MSFLAPWYVPLIAATATVPPLLLLYFLKLRRQNVTISSTLLWRQAIEDLRVNAPFQKLRSNLLLFLQLLVLLLAILALAEPVMQGAAGAGQAVVLMIDQSASMNVRESTGQTRLAIARRQARSVVDAMSTDQRAMVIGFADCPRVLTPFTDDKAQLRRAIDAVTPTDLPGRLAEAVALAEAHGPRREDGSNDSSPGGDTAFTLFTDGRLPDAGDVIVKHGRMDVVLIGQAIANVGIVDFDVRRNYQQPEEINVVARVRNFGVDAVRRDISLYVDGQLTDVEALPGLSPPSIRGPLTDLSGPPPLGDSDEAVVAFRFLADGAARVEVRLSGRDALASDNRAYAVIPPPRALSVLLVTAGNRYLRDVLEALPLATLEVWSPARYERADEDELYEEGRSRFDVVILDDHSTERLAPGAYLFFGSVPLIDGVAMGEIIRGDVLVDWDATHPVLRHVAIEPIRVLAWRALTLPDQAQVVIEGTQGPVLAQLDTARHRYLISAFSFFDESRETLNTNWVFDEGLVVFMHNALHELAGASVGSTASVTRAGEPLAVPADPDRGRINVHRPDGTTDRAVVRATGLAYYDRTDRLGIYRFDVEPDRQAARAVNLLDVDESFIAPYAGFRVAMGELKTGEAIAFRRQPFWPYLLAVVGVVMLIEWFVYTRRVSL